MKKYIFKLIVLVAIVIILSLIIDMGILSERNVLVVGLSICLSETITDFREK